MPETTEDTMPRKAVAKKPAEVLDELGDAETPMDVKSHAQSGQTYRAKDSDTPAEDDAPATPSPAKATRNTQDPFLTLDEVPEHLRLVYWGLEGSGKTTAALQATSLGKVLTVNAEGGLKKKPLRDQGVDTSQILMWPQPGTKITYKSLDALYRRIKADLREDPDAYAAIVFDSLSEIVAEVRGDVSADRIRKDVITDVYDKFFTDRSDYGTAGKMMRDLLRKFRDLPVHVIATALQRRDEDEDTKKVMYGPDVPPAVQNDLLGQFDIVIRTAAVSADKPFRALVRGVSKYRTKDRFGALPDVLAEPSFVRVLAYVEEDLDAASDDLQLTLSSAQDEETEEPTKNTKKK